MRTEVWYPLLGFLGAAWAGLCMSSVLTAPLGRAQPWVMWALGLFSAAMSLVAGLYASRGTWIEGLLVWVLSLSPVVVLVVGVLTLVGVLYLALGVVPDIWTSVTLSGGLVAVAFFLPMLLEHALPPGDVARLAARGVQATSDLCLAGTRGWFA